MALIFVGDVDCNSTEANVRSLFEAYGAVANVSFVSDFAFVEMPDDRQAQKAISDLNWQGNWTVRPVVGA
jgi:RNA recognition motif-containing protein